jgi:hypothetical protein
MVESGKWLRYDTVQIGFGALVLVGRWLTFVGWIAKPPAAS